ncbi:MAG: hypothetical protein AAF602_33180, partial [Myxococcota bacterium]
MTGTLESSAWVRMCVCAGWVLALAACEPVPDETTTETVTDTGEERSPTRQSACTELTTSGEVRAFQNGLAGTFEVAVTPGAGVLEDEHAAPAGPPVAVAVRGQVERARRARLGAVRRFGVAAERERQAIGIGGVSAVGGHRDLEAARQSVLECADLAA